MYSTGSIARNTNRLLGWQQIGKLSGKPGQRATDSYFHFEVRETVTAGRSTVDDHYRLAEFGCMPHEPQPAHDSQRRTRHEQRPGFVNHGIGTLDPALGHIFTEVHEVGLERPPAHGTNSDDEGTDEFGILHR